MKDMLARRLDALKEYLPAGREAAPLGVRRGRWFGKLDSALTAGGECDVNIWIWDIAEDDFIETSPIVKLENVRSFVDMELAEGAEVQVEWTGTTWAIVNWPSTPIIHGKARLYTGTWPTLQAFSESSSTATQRQWSFQKGVAGYSTTNNYDQQGWTAAGTAEDDHIVAYNRSNHYVPEGAIVSLQLIDGKYWFDWKNPPLVIGTLDAELTAGSSAYALMTVTVGYLGGGGKLRVYGDFLDTGVTIASGKTIGATYIETSFHDTSVFEPRWVVTSLKGC